MKASTNLTTPTTSYLTQYTEQKSTVGYKRENNTRIGITQQIHQQQTKQKTVSRLLKGM